MIATGGGNDNQSSTNGVAIIEIGMDEIASGQFEITMWVREEKVRWIIEEVTSVMEGHL